MQKRKQITREQKEIIRRTLNETLKLAMKELSNAEDSIKKASWLMRQMLDELPEKFGITKEDYHLMRLVHEEPYRMMFRMSGNWYLNDLRDLIRFIEYNLKNLTEQMEKEEK